VAQLYLVRPMHVLGTYRPFDTLPHAFFDAMALMVAASLLLAIAAAARTVWLRARPTGATNLASDSHLFPRAGLIPSCSLPWRRPGTPSEEAGLCTWCAILSMST
jgi:hypothetical protein